MKRNTSGRIGRETLHPPRRGKGSWAKKLCAVFMAGVLTMGTFSVAFAGDTLEDTSSPDTPVETPQETSENTEPSTMVEVDGAEAEVTEITDMLEEASEEDQGTDPVGEDQTGNESSTEVDADTPIDEEEKQPETGETPLFDPPEEGTTDNEDGSKTKVEYEVVQNGDESIVVGYTETTTTLNPDGTISEEKAHTEHYETGAETTEKNSESSDLNKTGQELLDDLKPDTSGKEWSDTNDGGRTKTGEVTNGSKTTTIDEIRDENGRLIGYRTETVTKTTESGINVIKIPAEATFTNEDGSQTTIEHTTSEDGSVTGYIETTIEFGEDGPAIVSTKITTVIGGTVTTRKETTSVTTQTVDPDAATTIEMGGVTEGENHGSTYTHGLDVDMSVFSSVDGVDFDSLEDDDLVFVAGVGIKSKHEIAFVWGQNINSMNSKNSLYATQYIVVDKDKNKHVVYCADMSTPADSDVEYYLSSVEDANYYTNLKPV